MNIYLYIKQHAVTNKLYFGKTTRKDPVTYKGSGSHWVNHLKKHGKDSVITLWYELFTDQIECMKFALEFSEKMDIVKSNQWLNQIPENGITGFCPGVKHGPWTNEHRANIAAVKKLTAANRGPKIRKKRILTIEELEAKTLRKLEQNLAKSIRMKGNNYARGKRTQEQNLARSIRQKGKKYKKHITQPNQ